MFEGFPRTVKKKKVRVALRKNRQNRTRDNDLTRRFREDGLASRAPEAVDRVRPKGELSRHRTIVEECVPEVSEGGSESDSSAASRRAVDLSVCLRGRVVRVHGQVSMVQTEDGQLHSCHVRRLLKSLEIEERSVVTVGDWVWFRPGTSAGNDGLVERVETRRGVITRGYRRRQHVIAANVDQVLVVSAFAEPGVKLNLIDRYLVSAETGGVRPIVVLNKADLVDLATHQWVIGLYVQLGYETIVTSVQDGRGLDRIRTILSGRVTALSGQSGVGKSSLLNAIQPGLNLKVREVSELDVEREAHDLDVGIDRARGRRVRCRHAWPEAVRALGHGSGRGRGVLRGAEAVHSALPLSGLLAQPRKRLRRRRKPCIEDRSTPGATRVTSSSTDKSRSTKHEQAEPEPLAARSPSFGD